MTDAEKLAAMKAALGDLTPGSGMMFAPGGKGSDIGGVSAAPESDTLPTWLDGDVIFQLADGSEVLRFAPAFKRWLTTVTRTA